MCAKKSTVVDFRNTDIPKKLLSDGVICFSCILCMHRDACRFFMHLPALMHLQTSIK